MKARAIVSHVILALLLLPSFGIAQDFNGKVVGVIDGDSIRVMHDGKAEHIRLSGIDCPEKGQSFGKRAKRATSSLSFGKIASVQPITTDRYGRTVARVSLPDGMNLNHELIKTRYVLVVQEVCAQGSGAERP